MVPAVSARIATTFDILSEGRILLNIVTGGSKEMLEGDGIFHDHDTRYEVTDEWLHIWRGLASGETVNFEGKHLRVKNGRQQIEPVQTPYPRFILAARPIRRWKWPQNTWMSICIGVSRPRRLPKRSRRCSKSPTRSTGAPSATECASV